MRPEVCLDIQNKMYEIDDYGGQTMLCDPTHMIGVISHCSILFESNKVVTFGERTYKLTMKV